MTSWEPLRLDEGCWTILRGLSNAPMTPQMLSRVHGISIADCWNRVRFLEGLGLITVVLTFISSEGRVLYFYQTAGDNLAIVLEDRPTVYFQPAV